MTAGNVFNFQHAQIWRFNSSGVALGQMDPNALPAAPATSHAYKLKGPISVTLPEITYKKALFVGGGRLEGSAFLGIDAIGDGDMALSTLDMTLISLLVGGLEDTTSLINSAIFGMNSQNPAPNQVGIMLTTQIQNRDGASDGTNEYLSLLFPNIQGRLRLPSTNAEGGTNPNPITMTWTPSKATKFPVGVAFGAAQGWAENSEIGFAIRNADPFGLTTWLQDGVATSFVLGYRPTKSTVTGGNTDNWVVRNGTPVAPTSISTTTALVTMAVAGTAQQYTVVLYPTRFAGI